MKTRLIFSVSIIAILIILIMLQKCSDKNGKKTIHVNSKEQVAANYPQTTDPLATSELDTSSLHLESTDSILVLQSAIKEENTLYTSNRAEQKLNNFLLSLIPPPQVYVVARNDSSILIGKKGTVIFFNPTVLETVDGLPISDSIRVELTEVLTQPEMIMNGVNTRSGDSLLISDGMYRIEMYSGKSKLRIKEGEYLSVRFPKNSDDLMSLFYGEKDSTGKVNWVLNDTIYNPKYKYSIGVRKKVGSSETIYYSPKSDDPLNNLNREYSRRNSRQYNYWPVRINGFGWVNIDKFLKSGKPLSSLILTSSNDSIDACKCFIIIKEFNSLISKKIVPYKGKFVFDYLPTRQDIKILAIAYNDTIPYIAEDDVFFKKNLSHEIVFSRTTEEKIRNKINQFSY